MLGVLMSRNLITTAIAALAAHSPAAPSFAASGSAAEASKTSTFCQGVKANALRSLGSAANQRPLTASAQRSFLAALQLCALELDLTDYAPNLKISEITSPTFGPPV